MMPLVVRHETARPVHTYCVGTYTSLQRFGSEEGQNKPVHTRFSFKI